MAEAPTSFLIIYGALERVLGQGRAVLASLVQMAADDALATGKPVYPAGLEQQAWLLRRVDEALHLFGAFIPHEAEHRGLAGHNPVAAFEFYEPISPMHGILDGRDGLVRAHFDRDMGRTCDALLLSDVGGIRWLRTPRSEIVAIKKVLPVPLLLAR